MSDFGPLETKYRAIAEWMRQDGFPPIKEGDLSGEYISKTYNYIMWLRDQAHIDLPEGMQRGSFPENSEEKGYT